MVETRKPETGQGRHNAAWPGDASVTPVAPHRDVGRGALTPETEDYHNMVGDGSDRACDLVQAGEVFNDTLVRLTGNSYRDYGDFFSGMMILSDAHLDDPVKSAKAFCSTFGLKVIPEGADVIEIDQIGVINRYLACIYAYAQDSGRWALDGQGSVLSIRDDGGVDRIAIAYDGRLPSFVLSRSAAPGDSAREMISEAVPFARMRRVMNWSDNCLIEPFSEVARGMDIGVIAPHLGVTRQLDPIVVPETLKTPAASASPKMSGP